MSWNRKITNGIAPIAASAKFPKKYLKDEFPIYYF